MSATYLPLSDNMSLSKELGTRHRAAVGMSEVSDTPDYCCIRGDGGCISCNGWKTGTKCTT